MLSIYIRIYATMTKKNNMTHGWNLYLCITWKFANYFVMEILSLLILFYDAFANPKYLAMCFFLSDYSKHTNQSHRGSAQSCYCAIHIICNYFRIFFLSHSHTCIWFYFCLWVNVSDANAIDGQTGQYACDSCIFSIIEWNWNEN